MRFRRLIAAVMLAVFVPVPAPANATQTPCTDVNTPVGLGLTTATMYGRLCVPETASTVMVLVPGGTYTHDYWDIPIDPDVRSVRLALNKAHIATMTVDRIGTGRSSKPLSLLVDNVSQAQAVHRVIQSLRPRFDKVVIGGHSIGSVITMVEAGTYRDVDGVMVTGMTHQWDYLRAVPALANSIPAALDPVLSVRGLDPGYLTTMPGARYGMFHAPGPNVSSVVDYDESTKDVFTAGEAVTTIVMSNLVLPASATINAPVLTVQTTADYFCGTPPLGADCSSAEALAASERPFFTHAPRVDGYVLSGYGHCFNFSADAASGYHDAVIEWARSLA
ncbi:alpha/beta hydrolase [Lentzea sp. NBRC 105346]|uniref:alpha/beta hydrolase n=1 Tax=Lentzea sp. NBRC 105346 TaxID=3032205 RepID=UPI0024A58226|nr:alpha/beta hydrolase [Lentzea sp. NBRC 105346]GLZ35910.1 alpha/beta hydrolase [Lentzea sp. NBRC 105346]